MAEKSSMSDNVRVINYIKTGYVQIGNTNTMNFINSSNASACDSENDDHCKEEEEYDLSSDDEYSMDLHIKLNSEINRSISKEVGFKWNDLAEDLNISGDYIEELEKRCECQPVEELAFQVLELWRRKHTDPTVDDLVKILKEQRIGKLVRKGFLNHLRSNAANRPMSLGQGSAEN